MFTIKIAFHSFLNSNTENDLLAQPKLQRTVSASVSVVGGESVCFPLNTKKVVLLKKGQVYPVPLPPTTVEQHGDIETVATRTAIGMEPLEGLLDEFPDEIKETIIKLLDAP